MLKDLINKAREKFTDKRDVQFLDDTEAQASDLNDIASLMSDPRATTLKKMLLEDIEAAMRRYFDTKDPIHMADVQANLKLLDKLTAKRDLDTLKLWLEQKLEEN